MKIDIQVTGLDELQAGLRGFSERRVNAAIATALTRTVAATAREWQSNIDTTIVAPTARTKRAVTFTGARANSLEASVLLKNANGSGSPAVYLRPQEFGGGRDVKKFERALIASGVMPSGYVTVPGRGAKLDGYGNVSRGQIVAVIRALGAQFSPGYQRVISKSTSKRLAAQAREGRKYVVVTPELAPKLRTSPGIYERMADGKRTAVFLFKQRVSYSKRLGLLGRVPEIERTLNAELSRAISESAARLAEKK